MSYSQDVLAQSLQDLIPGWVDQWTVDNPLWNRIRKGGAFNRRSLKGPWVEFAVRTGGPGRAVTDRSGSTALTSTRAQRGFRGIEYGARLIYHWTVPEKDLDESETEYDFANLVEDYGVAGMADLMQRMANQQARGASSAGSDPLGGGVEGFITLNSDQTYNPVSVGGARSGFFEYAAAANQTDTVHDLPKQGAATNPTTGWYHQYGHINNMGVNGKRVLRTVRDTANQQGASMEGGVDLLISDPQSYQNYIEVLDDQVMTPVVENDKGPGKIREGVKFGTASWFSDPAIDISDTTAFTTAAAQSGVIYLLCTRDWEMFTVGKKNSTKELFRVSEGIPVYDQPHVHFRMTAYANMFCKAMRRQGVVTGGATY